MQNNLSDGGNFRFENKLCRCGQRCTIKITEFNEKNNKGKLYYVCPNGICNMWNYCKPISPILSSTFTTNQFSHQYVDPADRNWLNDKVAY